MRSVYVLVLACTWHITSSARLPHTKNEQQLIGWSGESYNPDALFKENGVTVETLSWTPRAFAFHNLLTSEECDHLVELAQPLMEKSMVVDSSTGKSVSSSVRTSSGHFLRRGHDEVVARIERKLADATRLPVGNGESLHILHYQAGEKYEGHFDYFHDEVNTVNGGQRVATVLIYLSDVEEGGETVFPSAPVPSGASQEGLSECARRGLAFRPRKGSALLFFSLKPDGTMDPFSLHSGCPVIRGDKWSATKWIRVGEYKV